MSEIEGGNGGSGGPTPAIVARLASHAYFGMTDRAGPESGPQALAYVWKALEIMAARDGGFVNECAVLMDAGGLRLTLAQACTELRRLGRESPIEGDDARIYTAAMDLAGPQARFALVEAVAQLASANWAPDWPEDDAEGET
jgi:hypothetical protein